MNVRSSKTLICEDLTDKELAKLWKHFPWDKALSYVNRLQTRIAKAVKEGKTKLARRLQYLLTHSFYAKVLAVKKVVENTGRRTTGVDGVRWRLPHEKLKAALSLMDKGYRAQPLARIYIPKANTGKMRPLSIPTYYDRAMQALYAMALQPWAETVADRTSFGFRMYRSAQDAAQYLLTCLNKKKSAGYILEGDIKACFDNISHEWLLREIPMDKRILGEFLNAGYIHEGAYYDTLTGVPQGGIISPILANMALDGMEHLLKSRFRNQKVNLVRYADDWVVTAVSREGAEEIKCVISEFLAERGLSLSEEKTKIVHIEEGFDFLSWNFRKYNGKALMKPSKKAVSTIVRSISDIIGNAKSWTQESLIDKLNPVITGWTSYHRCSVASKIFSNLNAVMWGMLWHWAKRRHPDKGKQWIARRYWHSVHNSNWTFTAFTCTIRRFTDMKIRYHKQLQLNRNPYLDAYYFSERLSNYRTKQTSIYSFL